MSSNNSTSNLFAIAMVAILGLLGLSGYLFFANQNLKQTTERLAQDINTKGKIYDELNDTYNEAVAELDEMKGNNEELNAMIEKQKDELKAKKNQISKLLRTKNDYAKARTEMNELREQLDLYVAEINQLKVDNEALLAQNTDLDNQNKSLRQDLTAKSAANEQLETARAQLVSEKENLTERNTMLDRKVNIASVIKVNDIKATGWKTRKNGKAAKKKYAKNIDRLELCFNLSENLVTNPGEEEFKIRIINALGETLAVEGMGSGVLTNEATKEEIRYTKAEVVDYQNEDGQLCTNWEPTTRFEKGIYTVEIYNKGYMAGSGEFRLK
ncbi:MAG: hypothetical protein AAF960_20615 [Bacteroidota bacterium]